MKKYLANFPLDNLAAVLILVVPTIIYSFVGITKHNHFQTFAWDTSVFVQQIYQVSQLKAPLSSLHNGMNGLGDHFQVVFLILGGIFYKIWSSAEVLFFLQAVAAAFSGIVLFYITRLVLCQTKLSSKVVFICSLALTFAYLASVSFQAMMTDEFHNEPLAAVPLLSIIYFHLKRNQLGYWASFLVLLLTKEIYGLLAIPLAIYIFLSSKNYQKAFFTGLIGMVVFIVLVFKVMPALTGTSQYFHFAQGNSPDYQIQKFSNEPTLLISEFFNHPEKRKTIFVSLAGFGFLPLLSPTTLILPATSLAIRFYDDSTPRLYEFNNHYAAPFLPYLAFASVLGLANFLMLLKKYSKINLELVGLAAALVLITLTLGQDIILHGPLNSLGKPGFYKLTEAEVNAHALISRVPANTIVASQNSLLPHLSQREQFYLLPEIGDAQYIAVDLTDGPNKFSPSTLPEVNDLVSNLISEGKYGVIWQQGQSLLLERINF